MSKGPIKLEMRRAERRVTIEKSKHQLSLTQGMCSPLTEFLLENGEVGSPH